MIKVKLFGLLRLDSGIKEIELEAGAVKDIYTELERPLIFSAQRSLTLVLFL